jgi:P-type Cu+ transporter
MPGNDRRLSPSPPVTVHVPIAGMDCAECTRHVRQAIAGVPGVHDVQVLLAAEKAIIQLDPALAGAEAIRQAVERAGYSVPEPPPGRAAAEAPATAAAARAFTRRVLAVLGLVFAFVLLVVVMGEWFGSLERLTDRVPFALGALLVLIGGWGIFRNVVRAALRGQVLAHSLMSLGVVAALAVGQWATAAVVVVFMRIGQYTESLTAERARRAVRDLARLAPQMARVEVDGEERLVPAETLQPGQVVVVRPGEQIPADGEVVAGQATVDQASITGEAMPVEAGPGTRVFGATLAQLGSLRVRVTHAGADSTFGRVVRMVEEAEGRRAQVQQLADRFSAWYLPLVALIAALTLLLRRDPLATAAVLVVACSCSFALATPIAMLASIGNGARRGLLVKGGKYLELLARADVLLVDKTGTLTLGRPRLTDVVALNGLGSADVLALAASAEKYSEHPLAEALRAAAREQQLAVPEPEDFEALPGQGVRAGVGGRLVSVGRRAAASAPEPAAAALEAEGKTTIYVTCDGLLVGVLAVADSLRPEVPAALAAARRLGIGHIAVLTGDHERAAAALASEIGVDYHAGLLPEDKIRLVRDYQARGHTVVMVGDGVNDAPALAQADVGIAMGAAGSPIAMEAAHVVLMRDDWSLVPEVLAIARRTLGVVKMNLGFTAVYNVAGISLAAAGLLPPIFAAAAQSLPDVGILLNSSRLLRRPPAT